MKKGFNMLALFKGTIGPHIVIKDIYHVITCNIIATNGPQTA